MDYLPFALMTKTFDIFLTYINPLLGIKSEISLFKNFNSWLFLFPYVTICSYLYSRTN